MNIRLDHITKYYYDQGKSTKGIENISLSFNTESSFIVITGESGSGKTTLIRILTGLDDFDEGEIYFDDVPLSGMNEEEREKLYRENISFVFQDYNLVESLSAKENIVLALLKQGLERIKAEKRAAEVLEKVGLHRLINVPSSKLSGGERQRVAIARSLALNTKVIIFDEPTGNLDPETSRLILSLIREIRKNRLIVYVTHEYNYVADLVTRHIILSDGQVISDQEVRPALEASDTSEGNKSSGKMKFSSLCYASRRFSFRRKGRFLATFLTLALATFSMLGVSYSLTKALIRSSAVERSSQRDEILTSRLGNEVLVKTKDTAKNTPLLQSEDASDYYLDYGDLLNTVSFFYLVDDKGERTSNNFAYSPFVPNKTKLYKTYHQTAFPGSDLVDLYLPAGSHTNPDYSTPLKYLIENDEWASHSSYFSFFSPEKSTDWDKAVLTLNIPKVTIGKVYYCYTSDLSFQRNLFFSGSLSFTEKLRQSIVSDLAHSVSNKVDGWHGRAYAVSSSGSLTILHGTEVYRAYPFLPGSYSALLSLPKRLEGKPLSSLTLDVYGISIPLNQVVDPSDVVYDGGGENRFSINRPLVHQALIRTKGLTRIYAKQVKEAESLASRLAGNKNLSAAYFGLPESQNRSRRIVNLKNVSIWVRILIMLGMILYLAVTLIVMVVLRGILSKFYYRKDYDQMVLGWIGYSFGDMMKINAISFLSQSALLSSVIYVLMILLVDDLQWTFTSFPFIILLSFVLNLLFSFFLSLPSRKTRRNII